MNSYPYPICEHVFLVNALCSERGTTNEKREKEKSTREPEAEDERNNLRWKKEKEQNDERNEKKMKKERHLTTLMPT